MKSTTFSELLQRAEYVAEKLTLYFEKPVERIVFFNDTDSLKRMIKVVDQAGHSISFPPQLLVASESQLDEEANLRLAKIRDARKLKRTGTRQERYQQYLLLKNEFESNEINSDLFPHDPS